MSFSFQSTEHATQRMAQRGFRDVDLNLIMAIGTEVEGGILVREKDYLAIERELKRQLQKLRHLVGKRVVFEGGNIVTAYHATERKERRLLKKC